MIFLCLADHQEANSDKVISKELAVGRFPSSVKTVRQARRLDNTHQDKERDVLASAVCSGEEENSPSCSMT